MAVARRKEESNPFFVDDEDDSWGNQHTSNRSRNLFDEEEDTLEQLVAKKEASERRQLESLNRSIATVYETEDIGNRTAEELVHQGEQLDNTERKLDSIEAMTKVTQRQINSIKSVFGGIKNWFQAKNEARPVKSDIQHSKLKDNLRAKSEYTGSSSSISRLSGSHPHKATRLYNESDEEDEDQFREMKSSKSQSMIDDRLGILSQGITRLKDLGTGMNDELTKQNEQIHRLMGKVDKNEATIKDQNNQTRRML